MGPRTGEAVRDLARQVLGVPMIDLVQEMLITFAQAARMFPGTISPNTVARWALYGTKGTLLESVKAGRRRFTSKEAVHRFIYHLSERPDRREPSPNAKRRARLAEESLRRMGL